MLHRILTVATTLVVVTAACSSGNNTSQPSVTTTASTSATSTKQPPIPAIRTQQFNTNRLKWQAAGIKDYQFDVSISCFCAFERDPVTMTVHGATVSMTHADGRPFQFIENGHDVFSRYSTVARAFDELSQDLATAYDVAVVYDPSYGFPTHIGIDHDLYTSDDELSIAISSFKVLKQ